jgi:hypothetical protein
LAVFGWPAPARAVDPARGPHLSTAFYYGARLPEELLAHFDRVVVEPDNMSAPPAPGIRAHLFAYVSAGEVNPSRPWYAEVPRKLILGQNRQWHTDVVDTRSPEWRSFLLDRVIEPLYARGYRGVFLDTLDSYELVTRDPNERGAHAAGLAALVNAIRARHHDLQILINRGFEILPLLDAPPDGLVVESLFRTSDAEGHYREVGAADTRDLLERLRQVRARWAVPIAVIDYVDSHDRALRRETALRIWNAGFDPYVATPSLDGIGVGRLEIVPRRILLLYKNHPEEGYLGQQDACVLLAPVLEWLGYAVDYVDVTGPLPEGDLVGRYAGAVALVGEGVERPEVLRRWISTQLDAGLRIAFIEGFGFDPDPALLARMGLEEATKSPRAPVEIRSSSPYVGFEVPARAHAHELPPFRVGAGSTRSLLKVADAGGETWDGLVIGPWGGAAFSPYVIEQGLNQERRWVLDPFRFVHDALALQAIPIPDITTESGRRILTVHVDGDAFVSRAERRDGAFAGQVILDEILSKYRVPHTVSVIEGEIGPAGLYPADSPALEAIARRIFLLPYVEAGSHTFSHPFDWADVESGRPVSPSAALPIPNYKFDLDRDLRGSVDYIQTRLLPPGKRVRVLQWSGDCSPSAAAVAFVEALGIENVNGGGSTRTSDLPSLTRASAMGIPKGNGAYQVFAPIENENVFTNDWHGPYYGYSQVIDTFELNERPRRLSTISIYYHFYSGVKTAALTALRHVYDWALAQDTTRLYLSEYAAKVRAFQKVTLARRVDDGGWELGNLGELRTVRVDEGWGWPDLARSTGVAAVHEAPQGRYVSLARDADVVLYASPDRPTGPRLDSSNGRIVSFGRSGAKWALRVSGHEPLVIDVAGAKECTLTGPRGVVRATPLPTVLRLTLPTSDTGDAFLECI